MRRQSETERERNLANGRRATAIRAYRLTRTVLVGLIAHYPPRGLMSLCEHFRFREFSRKAADCTASPRAGGSAFLRGARKPKTIGAGSLPPTDCDQSLLFHVGCHPNSFLRSQIAVCSRRTANSEGASFLALAISNAFNPKSWDVEARMSSTGEEGVKSLDAVPILLAPGIVMLPRVPPSETGHWSSLQPEESPAVSCRAVSSGAGCSWFRHIRVYRYCWLFEKVKKATSKSSGTSRSVQLAEERALRSAPSWRCSWIFNFLSLP